MLDFIYTKEHEKQLDDFLIASDNGVGMSLTMAKGYLFSLICGPSPLEVDQWLDEIAPDRAPFDEQIVFSFMALYHDISEAVFNDSYTLPVKTSHDYNTIQHWSMGFLHGVSPYFQVLIDAPLLQKELKDALQMSTEQLSFFSLEFQQVEAYCKSQDIVTDVFIEQQLETANDFAKGYAQLIEAVAVESGLFDNEQEV
jgi:hypothetical protein